MNVVYLAQMKNIMQVMSHVCVANYDNGNNYACDYAEHDDQSAENYAQRH